jgi:adenine phosphoribosyltransferase
LNLKNYIRDIPDFPKPGIVFKDITPLLRSVEAFAHVEQQLVEPFRAKDLTAIAGIESRGFLFGAAVARHLGLGFIPIRKEGKLPFTRIAESYALEYGEGVLELHDDAVSAGDRILIIDDLLATGGTAAAAIRLVERLEATVVGLAFVIELGFLGGRKQLGDHQVLTLVNYDAE